MTVRVESGLAARLTFRYRPATLREELGTLRLADLNETGPRIVDLTN